LKDCFDLAGAPTSCGVLAYRDINGAASRDSWLVEKLRAAGAVIIGKTHMHPLAYGITGENPDFGDCLQPGDEGALTGGSSSGAAASVLEGSAVAALGTDTGGSIRAPAALCGPAGYRASLGRGNWQGGAHLAQSFDTMGWLFRDLEDAPLLAGFFAPADAAPTHTFTRFAVPDESFFYDCEPEIIAGLHATIFELEDLGLSATEIDATWWTRPSISMRPFRRGRQRASTQATLASLNPRFANGWSGARGLHPRKSQFCANAIQTSRRTWTKFSHRRIYC